MIQKSQSAATTCPLDCAEACGVLVETDAAGRFVRVRGNPDHSYSRGTLCGKTAAFGDVVTSPDRLRVPLVRRADGTFAETSWDAALDLVAERLGDLPGEDILALSYAGCMGLVNRYFPMRLMHSLGATETDGGICDTTTTMGYECVLGHVVGPDVEEAGDADLLVVWGADLRRTLQHFQPTVRELCRRGVPVVVVDVYRTDTIRTLEKWGGENFLPMVIKPGSDAALALALCRLAYEGGFADEAFLDRECLGAAEFRAHVMDGHDVDWAVSETGIQAGDIRRFADLLARSRRPFIKTGVGFARRRNGAMSMRAVASLAAVLGRVDRTHYESFEHFGLDQASIAGAELRPDGPTPPVVQVALGRELVAGRFRAAVVWGHNPAETLPDSFRVRAGLARDDLFLVVHELFMTETARLADVVLPATAFVEQSDVYRSYGHRLMQYGRKAVDPPYDQKSNVDAFRALGAKLGLGAEVTEVTEESLCRELLEASRERIGDAALERVLTGEPVKLPPREFADRGTPSGRIELVSRAAESAGQPAMATYVPDDGCAGKGAFRLHSAPSVATHNTTYGHVTRHVQRAGPALCHVNPDDAARLGVRDGATVRLSNEQGALTFSAALAPEMPPGLVRVDGFPRPSQMPEGVGINGLTSPLLSDIGDGNVLYSARVDVTPVVEAE